MNIDLELYRIFCEVVKYKNIPKTAESLYISQSAVTQSIQKLENMLGGKVFYRNKNGVELTEEGKNLYEYVKDSIETMSNAENIFSEYNHLDKGKVRIGGGNSLLSSLILEPIFLYIQKYPNIEISMNSGITSELMQKLVNGELDIVALNLPYNEKRYSHIETIPLKKASYCFFASKKYSKEHPIEDMKQIGNHPLIVPKTLSIKRTILNDYCKEEAIEINPNYEVSSSSLMKKMVLNHVGIGFTNTENLEDIQEDVKIIKK